MFYRGGNYDNTDNAGVFYMNGNNLRSNSNYNLGFRSALLSSSDIVHLRGVLSAQRGKGVCFHSRADSAGKRLYFREGV